VRAALAADPERNALPGGQDLIVAQEAEIMNPAAFMRPLGSRDFGIGNVYEMRTYTYAAGDIPKVLEAWAKVIESRERLSPNLTAGKADPAFCPTAEHGRSPPFTKGGAIRSPLYRVGRCYY